LKILEKTHALIERGDKIALIGANGKGKSTMLRIIAGTEPIEGERTLGYNVLMGFFAQHQLESLNVENTLLDELKECGSTKTETELRNVLGCFLFSNDDVFKKIKVLSGGEKSRVALAKTLISQANFLMLDEPTNHLDIQSVNILMQALEQYEGTFVAISHDRHFISQIANKIWYIEDHQLKEYPGTYNEYVYWQSQKEQSKVSTSNTKPMKPAPAKEVKTTTTPSTKNNKKEVETALTKSEEKITLLEQKIVTLEKELANPSTYSDTAKMAKLNKEHKALTQELQQEQKAWDKAAEELEALDKR